MWATIIMTILSFILTKKKTGSTSKALAVAALAGAGTYYATTQTDWFDDDNPLTSWPTSSGLQHPAEPPSPMRTVNRSMFLVPGPQPRLLVGWSVRPSSPPARCLPLGVGLAPLLSLARAT